VSRRLVLAAFVIGAVFGCDSSAPTEPGPGPSGEVPTVSLSLQFDDGPLDGVVRLRPPAGSIRWEYSVDLDEDGSWDSQGRLERTLGWAYRFELPGVHAIRIRLEGPADTLNVERLVVVNDPSKIRIEATGQVEPLDRSFAGFEGITISPDGKDVFVGDFSGGTIFRVDRGTLEVRDTVEVGYGVEGLDVSDSGEFLFVAHKWAIAAFRLDLPEMEPASPAQGPPLQNFFVRALDDERALFGGDAPLVLYDMAAGMIVARAHLPDGEEILRSAHFAVFPDGSAVAVADPSGVDDPSDSGTLRVLSLPDLAAQHVWESPEGIWAAKLAFSRDGSRLFALTYEHLYVLDARTGTVAMSFVVGPRPGLSVANPVALSRDGRFLAYAAWSGVLIVDVERGIPLYELDGSASVTTDPTVDSGFVLLDGGGGLRRIMIEP
jgi:sugar lactone lactonase YvrE